MDTTQALAIVETLRASDELHTKGNEELLAKVRELGLTPSIVQVNEALSLCNDNTPYTRRLVLKLKQKLEG